MASEVGFPFSMVAWSSPRVSLGGVNLFFEEKHSADPESPQPVYLPRGYLNRLHRKERIGTKRQL